MAIDHDSSYGNFLTNINVETGVGSSYQKPKETRNDFPNGTAPLRNRVGAHDYMIKEVSPEIYEKRRTPMSKGRSKNWKLNTGYSNSRSLSKSFKKIPRTPILGQTNKAMSNKFKYYLHPNDSCSDLSNFKINKRRHSRHNSSQNHPKSKKQFEDCLSYEDESTMAKMPPLNPLK
jgi:hypothetical protein